MVETEMSRTCIICHVHGRNVIKFNLEYVEDIRLTAVITS